MTGMLSTFVLPPVTIDKLNIAHGSCRKAHGPGKDSGLVASFEASLADFPALRGCGIEKLDFE
jgi:hypothetical protein